MLGDGNVDEHGNIIDTKECSSMYLDKDGEDREINVSLFGSNTIEYGIYCLLCLCWYIENKRNDALVINNFSW